MSVVDQGSPLLRQKRTLDEGVGMSDLCQKQTSYSFRFVPLPKVSCIIRSATKRSCRIHVAEAIVHLTQRKSHGVEEKEEELEIEDLKRTSLALGQRH